MRSLLAALLLIPAMVWAETALLAPGDALPALQLEDQHGQPYALPEGTHIILFTASKTAGGVANEVLQTIPREEQERRGIVYIADVSGMPSFVTRMFALPKMQEYAYRIMIGREPEQTAMLPRAQDAVTLLVLEQGRVQSIEHLTGADELKARLDALAPSAHP